jgi:hypothetical protein
MAMVHMDSSALKGKSLARPVVPVVSAAATATRQATRSKETNDLTTNVSIVTFCRCKVRHGYDVEWESIGLGGDSRRPLSTSRDKTPSRRSSQTTSQLRNEHGKQ